MSSTPTGKRSKFWAACTNKKMGFTEHFHPSTHNPNWGPGMEAEFRAQLSEQGYVHEILAEFGTQDTGVFDKNKVDGSINKYLYAYNELDYYQKKRADENNLSVEMLLYDKDNIAPYNPFCAIGVDILLRLIEI
jgi:replicative DNA helicase